MRRTIPEKISKLADLIAPYMILDKEKKQYVLVENAPEEIVRAAQDYHNWFASKRT